MWEISAYRHGQYLSINNYSPSPHADCSQSFPMVPATAIFPQVFCCTCATLSLPLRSHFQILLRAACPPTLDTGRCSVVLKGTAPEKVPELEHVTWLHINTFLLVNTFPELCHCFPGLAWGNRAQARAAGVCEGSSRLPRTGHSWFRPVPAASGTDPQLGPLAKRV